MLDRMAEAEVSMRLALYLLRSGIAAGDIAVSIDGAQVQTNGTIHFRINEFLAESGCTPLGTGGWQQEYKVAGYKHGIRIHSTPGQGDVVARLVNGQTLRTECKKGPLVQSKSSQEYPLMREALGQLMTTDAVSSEDLLAIAVPRSKKFEELASRWRRAPLIARLGICLLTVSREGEVSGLNLSTA